MNSVFLRIPKSGSTSILASILRVQPNFDSRHKTVDEIGKNHKFFTMIRPPLQQYCSTYYFLKNIDQNVYDEKNFMLTPFIEHMNVINQVNTIEEYLLNCPKNAFLTKYLCGLSPYDLESVGHVDYMHETRQIFHVMYNFPILDIWARKNPDKMDNYVVSFSIEEQFKLRNEVEYDLYCQALDHFLTFKKMFT